MDILDRMHRVWPSAWRANELLHGSKVQAHRPTASTSASPSERPKRVADVLDEDAAESPRQPSGAAYRPSQVYPEAAGSSAGQQQQQQQQNFTIDLSLPSPESPPYYPPPQYNRWTPADNAIPTMSGSLTTSVLPQQYSTGLVDERMQRSQDRSNTRYPQYWNDYSSLGQMDTAYSMQVMGDMVPQHSPPPPQSDQPMYVQDQYSLFSEWRSYRCFL